MKVYVKIYQTDQIYHGDVHMEIQSCYNPYDSNQKVTSTF